MATEKLKAQIVGEVDRASLKEALNEVVAYARDTGKKLDKETRLDYRINSAKLKMDLEKVRSELRQAKKDGDKQAIFELTAKSQKLQSDLTQANRLLNNYVNTGNATLSRLQAKFDGITTMLKGQFLGALTAIGAYITGRLATDIVQLAGNLEQTNIAYKTMLGSQEKATQLLDDLNTFAKKTPFQVVGLRTTAKELIAVGIEADNLIPTMKILGDVASGLGGPDVFGRLTYAFGQVKAAEKLTGMELRQFTETGVPLLDELAKNLGKTTGEIKEMVSNGEIGFNDVAKAFQTMSGEGGKFFNLMDSQSQTLLGTWSNLIDTVTLLAEKLGTALLPTMKMVVAVLGAIAQSTPIVGKAFEFVFTWISNKMIGFVYGMQVSWKSLVDGSRMAINTIGGYMSDLGVNISRTFTALPQAIKNSLNKGLEGIESFLNSAIDGVNNFAKKLGVKEMIGGVQLKRFDVNYSAGFSTSAGSDAAKVRNEAIKDDFKIYADRKALAQAFNNDRLNMAYDSLQDEFLQFGIIKDKELDYEYKNADQVKDLQGDKTKNGISEAEKLAKKQKEIAEKEMEAEMKREVKLEQFKKDLEEKRIEAKKKLLEGLQKGMDDEIKKQEKIIDGLKDQLKELEKIEDINKKIADRYNDIWEKIMDIGDEMLDFGDINRRKELEKTAETYKDVLSSLGGDEILTGGFTVDEVRKYIKLQEEMMKLKVEGQQASAAVSDQNIQNSQKTETEKLIEERAAIEEKLGLQKYEYETERASIEKRINDNQGLLEAYEIVHANIEKSITGTLDEQTQKRVALIKKEIAALAQLISMRVSAGMSTATTQPTSTTSIANTTNNNGNTNINVTDPTSGGQIVKMIKSVLNGNAKGIK